MTRLAVRCGGQENAAKPVASLPLYYDTTTGLAVCRQRWNSGSMFWLIKVWSTCHRSATPLTHWVHCVPCTMLCKAHSARTIVQTEGAPTCAPCLVPNGQNRPGALFGAPPLLFRQRFHGRVPAIKRSVEKQVVITTVVQHQHRLHRPPLSRLQQDPRSWRLWRSCGGPTTQLVIGGQTATDSMAVSRSPYS